MRGSNRRL